MWYNPHAMSATPKVSVITAAYKAARYIGQAIESVQAQTLTDWEMIIVDDASPDETAEVVKRYLDDPRIKLIRSERNRGNGGARNLALEVAQGEWIAVLDADDWFARERLENLWQFAQEKGTLVVADLQLQIDDEGKTYGVAFPHHLKPPTKPTRYTPHEYIYHHIPMKPFANREHIQQHNIRYPENMPLGEDHIFQAQILLKGATLWVLPETSYFYRIHPRSMVSTYGSSIEKIDALFEYMLQMEGIRNNPELIRCVKQDWQRMLITRQYACFAAALKRRQWRTASRYLSLPVLGRFLRRIPGMIYRRLWAREQLNRKDPRRTS
jgi:succinoglycan biosynthesis protein ExoO